MRYCVGLLHTPTADGRIIDHLDLPVGLIPVFDLARRRHVGAARNFHVVRGEIICHADISVGRNEVLHLDLGASDVSVYQLTPSRWGSSFHSGEVAGLTRSDWCSPWRQLTGAQRR